ncbi:MAG: carbohydrate binding domain-containing protein, partial [Planctomycetota bacterium]
MRKVIALLIILTSSSILAEEKANDNWLKNPGFELADNTHVKPASWHLRYDPEGAEVSFNKEIKRSGKQSLHIVFNKSAGKMVGGDVMLQGSVPARFIAGKKYTVSGWVKTKDLKSGSFRFDVMQYPAPFPKGSKLKSAKVRFTTDWKRLVVTFTCREKMANLMINLYAYCRKGKLGGEVWLDDFKVEEGDKATAFTDKVDTDFYRFGGDSPDHFPVLYNYRAGTDIITPHMSPSKGLSARPLKAYLIAHSSMMRWPAEIEERSGIKVDSSAVNGKLVGYIKYIAKECIDVMNERLKRDPEVIIMSSDTWQLILKRDRERYIEMMKSGKGLVIFDLWYRHKKKVLAEVPDAEIIKGSDRKPKKYSRYITGYKVGKGRLVTLRQSAGRKSYNTYLREKDADDMVRASYIAGGFDPADVTISAAENYIKAGEEWSIKCKSSEAADKWQIRIYTSNKADSSSLYSVPVEKRFEKVFGPGAEISADLPPLTAGNYIIEAAALEKGGKAIGWTIKPVACVGSVSIWAIESADMRIGKDKTLSADVIIESQSEVEEKIVVKTEAIDTNGRLLASGEDKEIILTQGQNKTSLNLKVPASTTPQAALYVTLEKDGKLLERKKGRFSCEEFLRKPDFRFGFYNEYTPGLISLGADMTMSRNKEVTDWGLRLFPWFDIVPYGRSTRTLKEEDLVTNPQSIKRIAGELREGLQKITPFRPVALLAIDEWDFEEQGKDDRVENLAYFKIYLKERYKTIAALNVDWQSDLKSFDEVTLEMCSSKLIRDKKAPPVRWADFQTMKEHASSAYLKTMAEEGRKIAPDFRLGLSGTRDSRGDNGLDWWTLMKHQGTVISYRGFHARLIQSFMKPGTRLYEWSYVTKTNSRRGTHDPWKHMLLGFDGYMHYGGKHADFFQPCFNPHVSAMSVKETMQTIRRGPAAMLNHAVRQDNGV